MDPWYRVVTLRREVREGRSFSPDEFAIALEQVVAGKAPEPLITLGSAPLHVPELRAVVLGQLGEARLDVAIDADIAGETAHARALDADATGALRDIHRRVGTTILFESSGGQVDKVAHLPELRFALGEPEVDTTTIDNAATALEASGSFIRKVGTDGYRIHHQATLKKVVSDRRASLDEETEVRPAIRKLVEGEFRSGPPPSPRVLPGRRRGGPGFAAPHPGRPRSRDGVDGRRPGRRAHRPVDEGAGRVAAAVPGRSGLVCEEAGTRVARQSRAVARLEAGGA